VKRILIIVAGLAALGGVVLAIVLMVTSADRKVAKQFVMDLTSGNTEAAIAAMHQELAKEFPPDALQAAVANAEPLIDVSFSSINASGGRTSLEGTATTATGCESVVSVTLLGDAIIAFNIAPMCQKP
jgi:hypothetical protein